MDNFSPEQIAAYFAPDGKMARLVPGYRHRQEQVTLAEGIARSFMDSEFLVSEAGTGVGKTYAYLIPSILWAREKKEKVVISTRTRALQQQLTEKDIPDVKRILDCEFTAIESKGRENYLCWNKYMKILAGRRKFEPGEQQFIESILRWAEETKSGDRKELSLDSSLMSHWGIVAADRKSCLRDNCTFHDKCFRLKMLRSLEKADLIVTNHALLLADMLVANTILPLYTYLVVDEAHTFERLAFDHLSLRFSGPEVGETLQLLHIKEKGFERGYLHMLKGKYPQLQAYCSEAVETLQRNVILLGELFANLGTGMTDKDYSYARVINWSDLDSKWLNNAIEVYLDWQLSIKLLISQLVAIKEEIGDAEESGELELLVQNISEHADTAAAIMEENLEQEDKITWLEYERGKVVAIASSSLDAGNVLNERLYPRLESMIMVSATLAIEERFDYFITRTGLTPLQQEERVNTLLQHSPFNYDEQAQLLIATDIPEPSEPGFIENVAGMLEQLITAMGGQILVLFTARSQLREIAALLRTGCERSGIKLLAQYEDGEFNRLLDEFIRNPNSVLMGVETFWEGIDLKGEILKCVVIVRLPFRPPTDPYCTAADRSCRLEKKNSFQYFMLPDAAVRFKQGAGRLIRSEEDKGLVVVLDSRLNKKSYGRVFRNSIPIKNTALLPGRELVAYFKKLMREDSVKP